MESISSGMNFLKRRFSSQDIADEDKANGVQAQSNPPAPSNLPSLSTFSFAGFANKVSSTISAPASPAKNQQSMYSQVQGFTRNLMQAASTGLSLQPAGPHKCILIIDDDMQIDWSKYFRNNRTGVRLCIEQAQFSEIDVCSLIHGRCIIDISKASKENRMFEPDFVLLRQAVKSEKGDYSNIIIALLRSEVQTLNSVESTLIFLNKNWMYNRLQRLSNTLGNNLFPLIEQVYYPFFNRFIACHRFPLIIRVGNGIHGLGKMKIDDEQQLVELEGIIRTSGCREVVVEQYVETKYDVHLQKIGNECKAFIRKSIRNNWKSNAGSAMLEQITLTSRHKQWLNIISEAFGGLEMFGVDILVSKDGREFINDVNDTLTLLGESQDDDRRTIADLIQTHIIDTLTRNQCAPNRPNAPMQTSVNRTGQAPTVTPPTLPSRPISSSSKSNSVEKDLTGRSVANGVENMQYMVRDKTTGQPSQTVQNASSNKPTRQPSLKDNEPPYQDDTMGQLKRTFAGIFGDV